MKTCICCDNEHDTDVVECELCGYVDGERWWELKNRQVDEMKERGLA